MTTVLPARTWPLGRTETTRPGGSVLPLTHTTLGRRPWSRSSLATWLAGRPARAALVTSTMGVAAPPLCGAAGGRRAGEPVSAAASSQPATPIAATAAAPARTARHGNPGRAGGAGPEMVGSGPIARVAAGRPGAGSLPG